MTVELPRRRERPEDIAPLALRFLETHAWPGNARKLRHVVYRAALQTDEPSLWPQHLPAEVCEGAAAPTRRIGITKRAIGY